MEELIENSNKDKKDLFPDGSKIDKWFYETTLPDINKYKKYYINDYCLPNINEIQTEKIQKLIDLISDNEKEGDGGILIIKGGYYFTGSLFLKNKVNLYIEKDSKIIGSNNIFDYPLMETRIEGETCIYYPALININNINNINIFGDGIIDGNGLIFWKAFWNRRKWNPKCTNKDEQRPRLLFISNCKNIIISNLSFCNSPFWTTHIYKCENIKYLNCKFYSPFEPIKAPSTDGIDIDYCNNILIKNCFLDVNDDAIALKGGKGPYADIDKNNGENENILIENCEFNFCHSCITCGSETIHNKNIIMRNCNTKKANNLLWIKMRPDTPQLNEHISIYNINGFAKNILYINEWTQFFDLKGRKDMPKSIAKNVSLYNINMSCDYFFNVTKSDKYDLSDFIFNNLNIKAKMNCFNKNIIQNTIYKNLNITNLDIDINFIYNDVIHRIKRHHIKCINNMTKPLFLISSAYPGVWLEHVYDSIMYAYLFKDNNIAINTINTFIDLQTEEGQYPCFIRSNNYIGYSQIQECVSFANLSFKVYELIKDIYFLKKIYLSSKKWVSWLYKNRMTLNKGLVEMFVGYDTGHDNSLRLEGMKYKGNFSINGKRCNAKELPKCDVAPIITVDMNCNLYKTLITISKMASILGEKENEIKYKIMANEVKKRLFEECYDKNDKFFYDVDKFGNKRKYLSSTIFHLFLEGILDKNEDKNIIDDLYKYHIKNENEFWTKYPFPSMAISEKNIEKYKNPNSWGYYSQALIALRCSLWMDEYNYSKDYDHLLEMWVKGLVNNYRDNPMSQELDPINGLSSGASIWYSTSMLLFIYAVRRLNLIK